MNITNINEQFGEYLYQRLPKVYRDYDVEIERQVDGKKKVFKTLQEYLYCFAEGGFKPLLEDLEAIISLLDPMKCPEQFLPVMLQHFGLDFIEDIPVKFQRRLVQNIITLYRKKGTIPAVAFLARELSGFDVTITETERGGVEFALVKINAYEDEDAELLLAQDVVQRYVHLFLPVKAKAEVIVTYGFTEYICQIPEETEESEYSKYASKKGDYLLQKVYEDYDSHLGFVLDSYFENESCLLKDTVQEDFDHVKILNGLEETYSFTPFDIYSVTDSLDEGDFVYTNGICCEDTIITQSVTSSSGEVEVNIPASSTVSVNKLVGGEELTVLPIYKCETDLKKGTTLKFNYDGKEYGYYTLERDLYASSNFPTTFQLDIYNNMVKVYNQYFTETIDGSYDFTLYSGYGSYHTTMRNGFVATDFVDEIRVNCGYESSFEKMDSLYFQPTTTPRIAFKEHDVYISLSDIITSAESAKEFVKDYPITIISPSASAPTGTNQYTSFCGQTIAYKKLSDTPTETFITLECKVYTMDDRTTVFAYESPVFMQNSNISIEGDYGVKVHPEVEVNGETIKTTDHLKNSEIINYEIYGNSYQATRSGKNLFDKSLSTVTDIVNETTITSRSYSLPILEDGTICDILKPNTTYTISCEFECTAIPSEDDGYTYGNGTLGFIIHTRVSGYKSIDLYIDKQMSVGEVYQYSKTFTTPKTFDRNGNYGFIIYRNRYVGSNTIGASMICRKIQIEEGTSSTEYEQYGVMPSPEFPSEIQSVGDLTKNLFDMNKLIEQGWVQQVDGSYYVKKSSTPYQQVLWENAENYTGQLKILFKVKYSLDNKPGCYLRVNYTDGTHLDVFYKDGTIVADTWYSPTISRTITDTNKTVKNVTWVYGSTISSTWVKDIIITKDITVTEYEPYHKYDIPITVRGKNLLKYPYASESSTRDGLTYTINSDTSITISGTATANSYIVLMRNCDFGETSIAEGSTNGIYSTSKKLRYNAVSKAVSINFKLGDTVDEIFYPQIEYGTVSTAYEPYKEETTHIYLDEPLRKVGDYADYIDFKNQKVIRKIAKKTYIGQSNEAWNNGSSDNHIKYIIPVPNDFSNGYGLEGTYGLSNIFVCKFANEAHTFYFTGDKSNSWRRNVFYNDTELTVDEWKSKLTEWNEIGNPLTIYYPLLTSREESISLPKLTTPNSDTMDMFLETSLQPSNINISYHQNQLVPQNSEYVYDLGMPLISFAGYSESIEKIDGKYYLRSAIKELDLPYMYAHRRYISSESDNSPALWFEIRGNSISEETPFYFNMSPCKYNVKYINTYITEDDGNKVALPNYADTFDFMCFYYAMGSIYELPGGIQYYKIVSAGDFKYLNGKALKAGLDTFKAMYDNLFRYSDIPPKFYIYDKYNKYGGETLTEITDKDIINKLNLLPIPQDYAIISSKGIKYSDMDIGVQSKLYY